MYVPNAKEVVEIAGSPDLFRVLWVNQPGKRVDLLALKERPYAIADVPFARLRPYQDQTELDTERTDGEIGQDSRNLLPVRF